MAKIAIPRLELAAGMLGNSGRTATTEAANASQRTHGHSAPAEIHGVETRTPKGETRRVIGSERKLTMPRMIRKKQPTPVGIGERIDQAETLSLILPLPGPRRQPRWSAPRRRFAGRPPRACHEKISTRFKYRPWRPIKANYWSPAFASRARGMPGIACPTVK